MGHSVISQLLSRIWLAPIGARIDRPCEYRSQHFLVFAVASRAARPGVARLAPIRLVFASDAVPDAVSIDPMLSSTYADPATGASLLLTPALSPGPAKAHPRHGTDPDRQWLGAASAKNCPHAYLRAVERRGGSRRRGGGREREIGKI